MTIFEAYSKDRLIADAHSFTELKEAIVNYVTGDCHPDDWRGLPVIDAVIIEHVTYGGLSGNDKCVLKFMLNPQGLVYLNDQTYELRDHRREAYFEGAAA